MARAKSKVSIENFLAGQETSGEDEGGAAGSEDNVSAPPETIKLDTSMLDPEDPTLPGFAMSDAPLPPPAKAMDQTIMVPTSPSAVFPDPQLAGGGVPEAGAYEQGAHSGPALSPETPIGGQMPSYIDTINDLARQRNPAPYPLEGEVMPPPEGATYESRIRILDAWQYPGNVATAPDYVDRNWIGFADPDELRHMPASPCLRVPLSGTNIVTICRPGDFVVRQETMMAPGIPSDIKVEVWERDQFQRLFIPTG